LKRNVLTVFMASPSDLEPERNMSREVVDRINKVINRRVDWHVELLGWEDTLPGYSRPQDMINKDVDCCDLFLGLLWRRWGQSTGKYTSGFHEEFLRACARRANSNSPEIWLFFKNIDSDNLEDPGDQLKKVVEFKKDQIKRKELLFREFADESDWEKTIYDLLLAYVLDLIKESQESGPDKATATSKETGEDLGLSSENNRKIDASYPPELGLMLQKANSQVNGNEDAVIDFWDITRMFLLASSWFSSVHSNERFGVHEINLVFSKRTSWTLSKEERSLIFRTIALDEYSTRPGWYWFRNSEDSLLEKEVSLLASKPMDSEIRKRALRFMVKMNYRPLSEILEENLSDNDSDVVLEAIKLLAATGLPEDIQLLDKALDSEESEITKSAVAAHLDLLNRAKPNEAFREYAEIGGNIPMFIDRGSKELDLLVDDDVLLESLNSKHTEVRRFVMGYLRALKRLNIDQARCFLKDADWEIRRQALWRLVDLGEKVTVGQIKKLAPPPPPRASRPLGLSLLGGYSDYHYTGPNVLDEFYLPILKQSPPEDTVALLDTYTSKIEVAYRYLAVNHFELIEFRIRRDLDEDFAHITSELEQKGWNTDTVDFVKAQMIESALVGLVEHGNESDLTYARKFLGKTRHNTADLEALKLIEKYGDVSDVENLVEVALKSGTSTQLAFDVALKFADNRIAILEIMLNEGDGKTAGKAAEELWTLEPIRIRELSRAMLYEEDVDKRLKGLAILIKFDEKDKLEALLDEYMTTYPHYYNVVSCLDKVLYAPGRLGELFRNELLGIL